MKKIFNYLKVGLVLLKLLCELVYVENNAVKKI